MSDIAKRFVQNPLLKPADLPPGIEGMQVACLLNPGVFRFDNKIWMLIRVAERPVQNENFISFPVLKEDGSMEIMEIKKDDPELNADDARVIRYKGADYLTTLSHLRLVNSEDGIHFKEAAGYPALCGSGMLETFGIEDCRVSHIGDTYYLTYTAVSENGVAVGMRTTKDWKTFTNEGVIIPPHNKDCAIFEEKIHGKYYAFHRPSSVEIGGNYIWLSSSPDGIHWGKHTCIIKTRPGLWDSARVGAGAAPIKTGKGWLAIYHGADKGHLYCLGAFLLDVNNPEIVLARTEQPIMVPAADYEIHGFFGKVVFTNGHIVHNDNDTVTVYYGAADEFICAANFSIREICSYLKYTHYAE
ncbi:MAG: glycoside hydrolase family 130 protein [Chitinophagaceae bacterium]|nr:glycoside hydrolase family 130 protein [Chitinophagaceae bacterium]